MSPFFLRSPDHFYRPNVIAIATEATELIEFTEKNFLVSENSIFLCDLCG